MKIYYYGTQELAAYFYTKGGGERFNPDPPRSLMREWVVPEMEAIASDERHSHLPLTDFPHYLPSAAFVSARAIERLRPIFDASGELLPVRLSNHQDTFYFFNVTRVINAVDMNHSKVMRFPSGGIMKVERLEFNPAVIPDDALFFKNTQLGPITEIYATEQAVNAVKTAKLTGHDFRLAWSNE